MQSRAGKNENTAADWSAWASVPWSPVRRPETETGTEPGATPGVVGGLPNTNTDANTDTNTPIGWLKSGIPYLPPGDAVALQTLDVWIPATTTTTTTTAPDPSSPPPNHPNKTWIVYIHGGAWRDPAITSASFTATATNLLLRSTTTTITNPHPTTSESGLAGLISLNYRLSPHPAYAASSSHSNNKARHPDHIADVCAALAFLGRLGILGGGTDGNRKRWVLAGHSCGATLAFQAVMHPGRWGLSLGSGGAGAGDWQKPAALVGFNGLYDLAGFIAEPPEGYGHLREGYREFVEGAFGADEGVWRGVCPATAEGNWVGEWIGDGHADGEPEQTVVLVQSREDTLVPWEQLEVMRVRLVDEGMVGVKVMGATGKHDDVWREGKRMAEVLWNTLEEL
ncbi:hypothetical protein B0I37DRAFT_406033 [Chaetomium sp. MPI-CAGE-AT-0009]|nr:hypothetical protein B0I37DRAFT_406033 [Chaetomium sp. MPI-CAGE-AT-0009]